MSHLENEFIRRFSNQRLESDDFDSEELWNNVVDELEESNITPVRLPWHARLRTKLLLSFLIVFTLGVLYMNFSNPEKITEASPQDNIKKETGLNSDKLKTTSPDTLVSKIPNSVSVVNPSIGKNQNNSKNLSNKSASKKFLQEEGTTDFYNKKGSSINGERADASLPTKKSNNFANTQSSEKDAETINTTSINTPKETSISYSQSIDKLHSLNTRYSELNHFRNFEDGIPAKENVEETKTRSTIFNLGFFSGINLSQLTHSSTNYDALALEKNMSEKAFWGLSQGIQFGTVINDRWSISTGLEYHSPSTIFDYKKETNSQVTRRNQLTKVWIDEITSDTIRRDYDDVTVEQIASRQIYHTNRYKRFSLPLELGIQKSSSKFNYGLSAGVTFNFTSSQNGKTINSNSEVALFSKDDSSATFSSFDLGIRIKPFIAYKISEHFQLNLSPAMTWSSRSNFDNTDLRIGLQQLNLNLGVHYIW